MSTLVSRVALHPSNYEKIITAICDKVELHKYVNELNAAREENKKIQKRRIYQTLSQHTRAPSSNTSLCKCFVCEVEYCTEICKQNSFFFFASLLWWLQINAKSHIQFALTTQTHTHKRNGYRFDWIHLINVIATIVFCGLHFAIQTINYDIFFFFDISAMHDDHFFSPTLHK